MIKCLGCSVFKPESMFYWDNRRNRPREKCKDCVCYQSKLWKESNRERKRASDSQYRLNNYAALKEKAANYYKLNKEKYTAAAARRHASKLKATPKWLTKEQLEEIEYVYFLCRDASLISDYEYHVDHIVPLQGKNVCGLHVPWNLQLLQKELNFAKGNRY